MGDTIQCTSPVSEEHLEALLQAMEEEERRIARAAAIASGLDSEDVSSQSRDEQGGLRQQGNVRQAVLLSLCGWDLVALGGGSSSAGQAIRADQLAIECSMCTRKVGLWSFLTQSTTSSQNVKPLDVIKEHRDFCAHVTPHSASSVDTTQEVSGKTPLPGWQLRLQIALGKALEGAASEPKVTEAGLTSWREGRGLAGGGDLKNVGVAQLLKRVREVLDS